MPITKESVVVAALVRQGSQHDTKRGNSNGNAVNTFVSVKQCEAGIVSTPKRSDLKKGRVCFYSVRQKYGSPRPVIVIHRMANPRVMHT